MKINWYVVSFREGKGFCMGPYPSEEAATLIASDEAAVHPANPYYVALFTKRVEFNGVIITPLGNQ